VLTDPNQPIAAVSAPREEEAVPTPEAAAAEGALAEPEVLREKKPEGEGEEEEAEGKGKEAKGAKEAKPAAKESKEGKK
jgi:hypothetical protein